MMIWMVVLLCTARALDDDNDEYYPWVGAFSNANQAGYGRFVPNHRVVHHCLLDRPTLTALDIAVQRVNGWRPLCKRDTSLLSHITRLVTKPANALACAAPLRITDPRNALDPAIITCLDVLPKGPEPCIAYHLGIADSWDWGDEMLARGCYVYSIDPETRPPVAWWYQRASKHTYFPVAIGRHQREHHIGPSTTNNKALRRYAETTLDAVMLLHGHHRVHFLRIDVEGAEFESGVIRHWAACGLLERIDNLLIEFHFPRGLFSNDRLVRHYTETIEAIVAANFTLYSSIHNPYDPGPPSFRSCAGDLHRVYETAWIRTSR